MNHLRGIDVDMNVISNALPILAVIAPSADNKVIIRNIEHTYTGKKLIPTPT